VRKNLISLFAGCGGLDLGLEQAGFTTVVANELEPHACESLRRNKILSSLAPEEIESFITEASDQRCFRKNSAKQNARFFNRLSHTENKRPCLSSATILEGDIREISSRDFLTHVPDRDVFCIAGGPPCQPFSKAGKRKTLDCTKNGDLFFEFVRLVKDLKPKWFIFENVKGLLFTKTDVISQACRSCGYESLADFVVRQNFEEKKLIAKCEKCGAGSLDWRTHSERGGSLRIILNEFEKVGYDCSYSVLNAADFGVPQIRERLFIVGSREGKQLVWPRPTHQKPGSRRQAELFDEGAHNMRPWRSLRETVFRTGHETYGRLDKESAVLWVKNVVRPHDEPVTWSLDRPSPTVGAHQGAKLAIAPNGVPEAQLLRQQWATRGQKQGDTAPVFVEHEYLSDQQLLELQSFPMWWYLHGTRMQRAFQIGNAVPPLLAKVVGEAVIRAAEDD
jgi:DNA (cytosine-5)-methyltransferase 1